MIFTKDNIRDLPPDWARELADAYVRDCPKYAHMLEACGSYAVIEEFWPDCEPEIRDLLEALIDLECNAT